ncbi:PAS domain S-box protein [Frigidibacter sp. MR17.14]|uniref:two-component system sensor histidine kinase NtrB n=1 Tax=Frigidibacter sp. MR17.14 TaxID=3126509 RepID=UPI003012A0FE
MDPRFDPGHDPLPWDGGRRRFDGELLSLIPLVAIAALVALIAALLWAVRGDEAETMRTQMASDALWLEQTLRFQLTQDEDFLARLSLDAAAGTDADVLENRARLHIANDPEVLVIRWLDRNGAVRRQLPVSGGGFVGSPGAVGAAADPEILDLMRRTRGRGVRPSYGGPRMPGATVSMLVPEGQGGGAIEMVISLQTLLDRHIPWWIAERYAVQLVDIGDRSIAARARMTPEEGTAQNTISFDPPVRGALLRITPYHTGAPMSDRLLIAGIAGLSLLSIVALIVLFRAAAQRRRVEHRLRAEMAFRRSMEESLTVGLRAKDHEGRMLYANGAFCRMTGFAPDELVGLPQPMPYWSPDRLDETLARQRALAENGPRAQSFETRFRHRDGHEIDVQVYEAPLIDGAGVHRGWMGSVIDISAAKQAERLARGQEESLTRTARLVTLGEMASTLAHELNQPLAAIASYAAGARNMIEAGRTDPALLGPAMEKLSHQAGRAGQIIRGIQGIVRKRAPNFERVSLAPVIAETTGFLAATLRERGLAIETELGPVPEVAADRILLEQVLINLIRNGMEAMGPGGQSKGGRAIRVVLGAAEGGVEIRVEDQGSGVDPEVADRIFDAFVSTKVEGMGMGLNVCRSIMELHHGRIGHAPRAGGGTVFRLWLPAAEPQVQVAE